MVKNLLRVGALSPALVPLVASAPAQASPAAHGARVAEVTTLADAVGLVRADVEVRTGYTRSAFRHRNSGDLADGCSTRNEVLLAEATTAPAVGAGCKLTGGTWLSYYDNHEVTDPGALDIDHMIPLAEAWDSGASTWTAARRKAYANDQARGLAGRGDGPHEPAENRSGPGPVAAAGSGRALPVPGRVGRDQTPLATHRRHRGTRRAEGLRRRGLRRHPRRIHPGRVAAPAHLYRCSGGAPFSAARRVQQFSLLFHCERCLS
ncbi:hypothetical protein GCM10028832_01700 [Streptomyces sparsus]